MDWEFPEPLREEWKPVSAAERYGWLAFYALFLAYAARATSGFLFIDILFVPIHEGGHLFFSYFGEFLHILGGTLFQVGVPFLLAVYFAFQRQATGTAFCAFFVFENFLNVATYMADSRALLLNYVTVGDPDLAEHDWRTLFSQFHVLAYDTRIAAFVRALGWLGMLAVVAWFWYITRPREPQGPYALRPFTRV